MTAREMATIPDGLEKWGTVMSNFDHEVNPGAEEALRTSKYWGSYPARNFWAGVWFADGEFHAEIHQYHVHIATISADMLEGLMEEASARWGDE